jgi:hypothetical protein
VEKSKEKGKEINILNLERPRFTWILLLKEKVLSSFLVHIMWMIASLEAESRKHLTPVSYDEK